MEYTKINNILQKHTANSMALFSLNITIAINLWRSWQHASVLLTFVSSICLITLVTAHLCHMVEKL